MSKAPKLRFKEFSGDWESKRLNDLCEKIMVGIASSATHAYRTSGIIMFRNQNIKPNHLDDTDILYLDEQYEKTHKSKRLMPGDLLTARTGYPGTTCVVPDKYINAQSFTTLITRPNKDLAISEYLSQYINSDIGTKFFKSVEIGGGQKNVNAETLKSLPISIPSLKEQEKIASFFSLIDDKISLQGEKVEALKDYKKGMMQKIFSRELRFKDDEGRDYPEWKIGKVKDVITEHLYPIEKPSDSYWRLGLRSHGKGTFHEYVTDPSKVSMDKLYEVKKNMLIVNITFAWEHAIAITDANDEGKLVSHRFPTYDFNENALYDFYKYYILLPKFKYCLLNASPGGAGRNRVLNKKQFLEIDVPIPCIDEQKKIAKILNKLDVKINKEQEKLDSLNEYKKGLLQQMFV